MKLQISYFKVDFVNGCPFLFDKKINTIICMKSANIQPCYKNLN